ncbi:MAG: hypothetical protein GX593_00590 [Actinomycetales bacterium]|nr:hypothetical protein [Actinomycetales bacterium]
MTLETALLFVVVVAGATWVGGSIACTVLGTRIARSGDTGALGRYAAEYVQVAPGLFGGTGFLTLVAAIWLVAVSDGLDFVPWVIIALVLWFASLVLAATAVGFSWTRIAIALGHTLGNDGGARTPSVDSATAPELVKRALRLSWIDIALRVVVVLLVVWQPA